MAAYLIEPHTVRLDYDERLERAVKYACDNQIHILLWPAGEIIPRSHKRILEKLDVTTFGGPQQWIIQDELEVSY